MIFYFASSTYQQVISSAIKDSDIILVGQESKNDIYFLKYVRENFSKFNGLDTLIIDLNAMEDTDEEIREALDALKISNDDMRIIILAANRYVGDNLLTQCFQMGIYNLIVSDDFLEIANELRDCILIGKKYADSLQFRDAKSENVIVKEEIKQTVNRILIAMAGTVPRIGVTHHCIILANWLRKKGYMVAIVEEHDTDHAVQGAFAGIQEFYEQTLFDDYYFSMSGIDYYPRTKGALEYALAKSYNFIIADFGVYKDADLLRFNKSDVRIVIGGSKPWEIEGMQHVFGMTSREVLLTYKFYFNMAAEEWRTALQEGMPGLEVYFLGYTENPFKSYDFPSAEKVLENYMAIKIQKEEKKSFFGRKGNGKEKKK